jgi:hypothetical protein
MVLDPLTGLYNDEARWYSTATSGFISTDPAQADLNTYRYCGNMPTVYVDFTGLDEAPNPHFDFTNKLSDVRTFTAGKITVQIGADAMVDGRFEKKDFGNFDIYETNDNSTKKTYVSAVIHAKDQDRANAGPNGGVRVWASAKAVHHFDQIIPGADPEKTDLSGITLDKWFADDSVVYPTKLQDFSDFPGIADVDDLQSQLRNVAAGAKVVKNTNYGVAVLCWDSAERKLNPHPLDSFYYSVDITITKDSANVVIDYGKTYDTGGHSVTDWAALKTADGKSVEFKGQG